MGNTVPNSILKSTGVDNHGIFVEPNKSSGPSSVVPVGTVRVMIQKGPKGDIEFIDDRGREGVIVDPELSEIAAGGKQRDCMYYGRISQIAVLPEYRGII